MQTEIDFPRLPRSSRDRFEKFHAKNPEVYRSLVQYARIARNAGHRRIGIRLVWERMRWDRLMTVEDPEQSQVKLNDHYPPYYARLIMQREPDLAGIFEIRQRRD